MRFPLIAVGAVLFALSACDGEVPSLEEAKQTLAKASKALENLDANKVQELAKLVSELEKDPAKAEQLLKDHGITREQLDQAVKAISENPQLKQAFDAAKQAAERQR